MTVFKIEFSLCIICLTFFVTGCSTMNVYSTPPVLFVGMEDGDAFTVVLEENASAPQNSDETEREIGQCIFTEIQRQKPAVRLLPSDRLRFIRLSDDTDDAMDQPSPCSYMKGWFSPRTTTEETAGTGSAGTGSDGADVHKEGTEETLTPEALHLQKQVAHLGARYVICASKQKLEGGEVKAGADSSSLGVGYSGYKSVQLTAWIFDVKNWSESGQSTITVRDESFYGVVAGGGGGGAFILPVIWPAFYRDSKACKALGEEIAKLVLETPGTPEQGK